MTEWWNAHDGALIGTFAGAGGGVLGGVFGSLIGVLAPRGIGRRVIVPLHIAVVLSGAACLVAGVVAVIAGQPYHVFYPLLLIGGILTLVMGGLLPVVLARYRQAEAR